MWLFTDASDLFWGAILTQVDPSEFQADGDPNDWNHEPLGFLNGPFKNSQLRWSVADKEGYAIKNECEKFTHLLIWEHGLILLFTGHRNLVYISIQRVRYRPSRNRKWTDSSARQCFCEHSAIQKFSQ